MIVNPVQKRKSIEAKDKFTIERTVLKGSSHSPRDVVAVANRVVKMIEKDRRDRSGSFALGERNTLIPGFSKMSNHLTDVASALSPSAMKVGASHRRISIEVFHND